MSATNRRPLARTLPSGSVLSEFHDGHGQRTIEVVPSPGGALVTFTHSDGRSFTATVPCQQCAHKAS